MDVHIRYNAVFEPDGDSIYIHFPDIPNAFTCAYSRDHAIEMAKEVLDLVLHGEKYSELPKPTSKSQIKKKDKTEVVSIEITMGEKNGVLFGYNVIEYTDNHDAH